MKAKRQKAPRLPTILDSDRLVSVAASMLRRVSVDVENDDTRRFFIPVGLPVKIDLNRVTAVLLRGLARGIELKAARVKRGVRVG